MIHYYHERTVFVNEKVIVVIGAAGVLGNSFIHAIADTGGIIGILARNKKVAEQRASSIINKGGKAIALKADVLNQDGPTCSKHKMLSRR